jgi:hypothetical protein
MGTEGTAGEKKTTGGTSIGQNIAGGALFGGLGGLLIGLGALAIPGLGPIVAAGPIATTLAGAGIGAAGGGLIGALKDAGVPDEEAGVYAESIRRGGTMVTVRAPEVLRDRVADILDEHGAVDVDERASSYRTAGWTGFDASRDPEDHLDLEKEAERAGIQTLGLSETAPKGSGVHDVARPSSAETPVSEPATTGMGTGPHTLTPSGIATRGAENPVVARRRGARVYTR